MGVYNTLIGIHPNWHKARQDTSSLGEIIRILRIELGLTQAQIAYKLNRPYNTDLYETAPYGHYPNVTQFLISRAENGKLSRDRTYHLLHAIVKHLIQPQNSYYFKDSGNI